jgi:sarcosine oxidase
VPLPERFDVAVVGLGLIGSAALRHLSMAGVRCVGVGPDEPADFASHLGAFASHYDSGRITRMLDSRFEWGLLAKRSISNYRTIEEQSGHRFHRPTGLVYAVNDERDVSKLRNTAGRLDIVCRVGRSDATFPDSRLALPGRTVFVEPAPAGHIDPRIMRVAQLEIAARQGAQIVRSLAVSAEPIDAAIGGKGGWRIQLGDGTTHLAERVLVAAGPHADEFLAPWGRLAYEVRNEAVIRAGSPCWASFRDC